MRMGRPELAESSSWKPQSSVPLASRQWSEVALRFVERTGLGRVPENLVKRQRLAVLAESISSFVSAPETQ